MNRKRQGTRVERQMAELHESVGLRCRRVPGSGAFEMLPGDLRILNEFQGEVKSRAEPPKVILNWLGMNDILFIVEKGNPKHPTVHMRWEMYVKLMRAYLEVRDGES